MDELQDFATQAAAISSTDQEMAEISGLAGKVSTYWKTLVSDGLPPSLIAQLTMQAAQFLLSDLLGCGCDHGG